jgi:YCII-related domain
MPKYLCLQRGLPGGTQDGDKPSPSQMQAMYAQFNEWRDKFRENIVDLGGRLASSRIVLPDPAPDGPLVEVKELVGGYMIVSAASHDEAIEIAKGCPGLVHPGSGVEVIEIRSPG